VSRKPPDHHWQGFTQAQAELLDRLDFYGNNAWANNPQAQAIMPGLLGDLAKSGVPLERAKEAMRSIGYDEKALRNLDRW